MPKDDATSRTEDDPRWARTLARDASADGLFWYSVATTGVYCRPSCPSRAARPGNVAIHDTLAAARACGARPCKRCSPDGSSRAAQDAALVEQVCRLIEASDAPPRLQALADAVELSPGHLHRLFKAATGITPRAYGAAHRARRVRAALAGPGRVTDAILDAGFGSSGRFYEAAGGMLGMTPERFRNGGAGEVLRVAVASSTLGAVLVALSDRGVAAIMLGADADALMADLAAQFPAATLVEAEADAADAVARVVAHVEAPGASLDLPLDLRGTAFQTRVWDALRRIPPGETATYAGVAAAIGAPGAVRAVARACATNRVALAVPCHRVVRADGTPSGYRWGLERKAALLAREGAAKGGAKL